MAANAYDFRDHPTLVELRNRFAAEIPLSVKDDVVFACEQLALNVRIQVPPFNIETAETMTLGELADLGVNDPGAQLIDETSMRNLGFGPQGMIKIGSKPSNLRMLDMPKVVYREEQGQPSHPANASGRHRCYFLQMYADACGVDRELAMRQPIWVVKQVCRDRDEFGATMIVANASPCGPRKQPPVERIGYTLSTIGVEIKDFDAMMASYQGFAKVNHYPDVFGVGLVLAMGDECRNAAFTFDAAKRAYNFVYKATADNRTPVKRIFTLEPERLRAALQALAVTLPGIESEVAHQSSPIPAKTRVAERLSDELADLWGIQPRVHPTDAEVAEGKIEAAKSTIESLKDVAAKAS